MRESLVRGVDEVGAGLGAAHGASREIVSNCSFLRRVESPQPYSRSRVRVADLCCKPPPWPASHPPELPLHVLRRLLCHPRRLPSLPRPLLRPHPYSRPHRPQITSKAPPQTIPNPRKVSSPLPKLSQNLAPHKLSEN